MAASKANTAKLAYLSVPQDAVVYTEQLDLLRTFLVWCQHSKKEITSNELRDIEREIGQISRSCCMAQPAQQQPHPGSEGHWSLSLAVPALTKVFNITEKHMDKKRAFLVEDTDDVDVAHCDLATFAGQLCANPDFVDSKAERAARIAAASYGLFQDPDVGYLGANEWRSLTCNSSEDLVIFAAKTMKDGTSLSLEIGFRGTVATQQWFSTLGGNLNYDLTAVEQFRGKVHAGFWTAYCELLQAEIKAEINEAMSKGKQISTVLITGHSRGAALATLCAVDLLTDESLCLHIPCVQLVTFGSPKVGDPAFGATCNELGAKLQIARFVNRFDPVPSFPLEKVEQGGEQAWLTSFAKKVAGSDAVNYAHVGDAKILDGLAKNPFCLFADPIEAVMKVHAVPTYFVNLRNQFRDPHAVLLEGKVQFCKKACVIAAKIFATAMLPTDVLVIHRMDQLETTILSSMDDIHNAVVKHIGECKEAIKSAQEHIIAAVKEEHFQDALKKLVGKTEALTICLVGDKKSESSNPVLSDICEVLARYGEMENHTLTDQVFPLVLSACRVFILNEVACGTEPHSLLAMIKEIFANKHFQALMRRYMENRMTESQITKSQFRKFLVTGEWAPDMTNKTMQQLQSMRSFVDDLCLFSKGEGHSLFKDLLTVKSFMELKPDSEVGTCKVYDGFNLIEIKNRGRSLAEPTGMTVCLLDRQTAQVTDVDGSSYEGPWVDGLPSGSNGTATVMRGGTAFCQYKGDWRVGLMHGRGCLKQLGIVQHDGWWHCGVPILETSVQNLLNRVASLQSLQDASSCREMMSAAARQDSKLEAAINNLEKDIENQLSPTSAPTCQDDFESAGGSDIPWLDSKLPASKLKVLFNDVICNIAATCILCTRLDRVSDDDRLPLEGGTTDSPLFLQLRTMRQKVNNTTLRVPFLGPVKSGKSMSLNSMLGERFNPSDTLPLTVLPTIIQHKKVRAPSLEVPHVEMYKDAAVGVNSWRTHRHINTQGFDDVMWSLLKDNEKHVYQAVTESKFTVSETADMTGGDGYKVLTQINQICRVYARAQKMIDEYILQPLKQLERHCATLVDGIPASDPGGSWMDHVWDEEDKAPKKKGVKHGKHSKDSPMKQSQEVPMQICDGMVGLIGKVSILVLEADVALKKLPQKPVEDPGQGFMNHIGRKAPETKYKEDVQTCVTSVLDILSIVKKELHFTRDLEVGLLTKLMEAGKQLNTAPWPRISFDIIAFNAISIGEEDNLLKVEVIDTPGLDEVSLIKDIYKAVESVVAGSEGTVVVYNSTAIGTDAFTKATELGEMAVRAGKPVFALANRLDDIADKKKHAIVKKEIAKALFCAQGKEPAKVAIKMDVVPQQVPGDVQGAAKAAAATPATTESQQKKSPKDLEADQKDDAKAAPEPPEGAAEVPAEESKASKRERMAKRKAAAGIEDGRSDEAPKSEAELQIEKYAQERVFGVSALYGFYSSVLEKHILKGTFRELAESIAFKIELQQDEDEEDEEFTDQETELVDIVKEAFGVRSQGNYKQWEEFAANQDRLAPEIEMFKKQGGMEIFVDNLTQKLAPRALACQSSNSLFELTSSNGAFVEFIRFVGQARWQMGRTSEQDEQSSDDWETFTRLLSIHQSDNWNRLKKFQSDIKESAEKAVNSVMKQYGDISDVHSKFNFTTKHATKRETEWRLTTSSAEAGFRKDFTSFLLKVLKAQSQLVKEAVEREVGAATKKFRDEQVGELMALNPPEKALQETLSELTMKKMKYQLAECPSKDTIEFEQKTKTRQGWFWNSVVKDGSAVPFEKLNTMALEYMNSSGFPTISESCGEEVETQASDLADQFIKQCQTLVLKAENQFIRVKESKSRPNFKRKQTAIQCTETLLKKNFKIVSMLKEVVLNNEQYRID